MEERPKINYSEVVHHTDGLNSNTVSVNNAERQSLASNLIVLDGPNEVEEPVKEKPLLNLDDGNENDGLDEDGWQIAPQFNTPRSTA